MPNTETLKEINQITKSQLQKRFYSLILVVMRFGVCRILMVVLQVVLAFGLASLSNMKGLFMFMMKELA